MNDIDAALARRHPSPEWALFFEVRNDAGFRATRSADAVAMNTWPSRGLAVHGFEIKRDRRDWLRELKQPEKSAPIQRFCDHWWIVATLDVVKPDELPPTWGLLVLRGKRLVAEREAPTLGAETLTRGFVAALLRSADVGKIPKVTWDETVEKAVEERLARDKRNQADDADRRERELTHLRDQLARFEKAAGINLEQTYTFRQDPERVGRAVRVLLDGGLNLDRLKWARENIVQLAEAMKQTLEAFKGEPIDPMHGNGAG